VIAHAASRARADASFVLNMGCMAAFWAPKQVDIVRDTLRGLHKALKKTRDMLKGPFKYVQQPGRLWKPILLCAKKDQKLGAVVID
jgi:hypothetical protein